MSTRRIAAAFGLIGVILISGPAHRQTPAPATSATTTRDIKFTSHDGYDMPVYSLYRNNLTPLNVGFFTYEGRGVFTSATGGRQIERTVYDTSTLDNKVRDGIFGYAARFDFMRHHTTSR
jgi:hypothetical protein